MKVLTSSSKIQGCLVILLTKWWECHKQKYFRVFPSNTKFSVMVLLNLKESIWS
ncbi:hypothetical protein OIU77_003613, partial [Salix suchowensis]